MKKAAAIFMAVVMMATSGVLTSCVTDAAAVNEFQETRGIVAESIDSLIAAALGSFPDVRMIELTEEAREIALEDFDYLVEAMLDTLPTQGIAGRLVGMPLDEYFAQAREILNSNIALPTMFGTMFGSMHEEKEGGYPDEPRFLAADYLFTMFAGVFLGNLKGLGHISPWFTSAFEMEYLAAVLLTDNPEAAVALGVPVENLRNRVKIFGSENVNWFYGVDSSRFDLDVDIMEVIGEYIPDNITTSIIEPGRIAYFHISKFLNNLALDSQVLFPFYEEIQDYEHLIIDLRGNKGGLSFSYPTNVLSMLIDEPIYLSETMFYKESDLTAVIFENYIDFLGENLKGVFPAAEFVQSQDFEHFNDSDLDFLDYAIVLETKVEPAENAIPFSGEIWVLIDGRAMSAAHKAALFSANTGFATVVGEPSSIVSGVEYTYITLPNTGILVRTDLGYTIDQYGRALEEHGVIPQIANTPGMDALETVLELINQSYSISE